MNHKTAIHRLLAISTTSLVLASATTVNAQSVAIDSDDIDGVVTSANGPEAGVWVIAETNDFQTQPDPLAK